MVTNNLFLPMPVVAAASRLQDGTMKLASGAPDEEVFRNRGTFLTKVGITRDDAVLCNLSYEDNITYDRIVEVGVRDKAKGMAGQPAIQPADAWFTKDAGLGLFLPLADCGGVVVYDQKQKVLGMLHLGRHATFDGLATKVIEHMKLAYGTRANDIIIWISPSIGGDSYWLHAFDFANDPDWRNFSKKEGGGWLVDLQGYNIQQFIAAGVAPEHIEHAGIDTATHPEFPSHHRHNTHGEAHKAGRFAAVAFMTT